MFGPINPNDLRLSILGALTEEELTYQKQIIRARKYLGGQHQTFISERMNEFLNLQTYTDVMRFNIVQTIVRAVTEKLTVKSIECGDDKSQAWAARLWAELLMGVVSDDVHETAINEAEGFVIVDWDKTNARPRILPHPRYTDLTADRSASGFGCEMVYEGGDPNLTPLYAVKRWTEYSSKGEASNRVTFYYPDRIEKFVYAGGWKPYNLADEPWPLPWIGTDGKPLGIPVIHFKNKGMTAEAKEAWPLQDALNKTVIDLLAVADMTGFPIFKVFGFYPTSDGKVRADDNSNASKLGPGQLVGTAAKGPNEASLDIVQPGDMSGLMDLVGKIIYWAAISTDTPVSRFRLSGLVAAEETQKQENGPLIAKIEKRQELFGGAWAEALRIARRLQNVYGTEKLDEAARFVVRWADPQARTNEEKREEWKVKREVGKIPLRQLWAEMGYTPEQIETMLEEPEIKNLTFAAGM